MEILKSKTENLSGGDVLRHWRQLKRISQMDLALDVGVSSKHLSFVENGKSRPSRKLVLRLAQALKLPLRHRNALLNTAGFVSAFSEEPFDGERMTLVRQALQRMIDAHEPYPAFVVNANYDILMANAGLVRVVRFFLGEDALVRHRNVYRMMFADDGLRPFVHDWPTIEHFLLARLWEEMVASQNSALISLFEEITQLRTHEVPHAVQINSDLPILNFVLEKEGIRTSFFSTITTLGTPLDLTTQELRIESLFPVNDETRDFFH